MSTEEVVENVTNMTFEYLPSGSTSYLGVSAVNAGMWADIRSVRIVMTMAGQERVGPSGETISRQLAFVAAMRNRNP